MARTACKGYCLFPIREACYSLAWSEPLVAWQAAAADAATAESSEEAKEVRQEAEELASADAPGQEWALAALRESRAALHHAYQQQQQQQPGVGALVLLRAAADSEQQEVGLRAIMEARLKEMLAEEQIEGDDLLSMVTHKT